MVFNTTVLLDGLEFPESPRWHGNRLWFSDQDARRVMTVNLDGKAETIVEVPAAPSGLGWFRDGSLAVVSIEDQRLMRFENNGLEEVADLSDHASFKLNDMVVDHQGRAYVGNFGYELLDPSAAPKLAEIVLVTANGEARVVADEMAFPNGTVITPDGRTLIVAESLAACLTAFAIEPDGSLTQRRIWAQFDDRGFAPHDFSRIFPDGICLDAEGAIWVASPWGPSEVMRVLEGGEITHRVKTMAQPFAVMLGAPDRQTLFVCTSTFTASESPPGSGRIETVRVNVPGAGLP